MNRTLNLKCIKQQQNLPLSIHNRMTDSSGLHFVSPYAFEAIQKVDVMRLAALSDPELRLLLPCLVRMALCAPADQSNAWAQDKKQILRLLSGVEAVNSIVALLSVDFHALEQDARKEQQLRYNRENSYLAVRVKFLFVYNVYSESLITGIMMLNFIHL